MNKVKVDEVSEVNEVSVLYEKKNECSDEMDKWIEVNKVNKDIEKRVEM